MAENMLGIGVYHGRDKRSIPLPRWKALGFLTCPTLTLAEGTERLYRVWSEQKFERGSFFSFTRYRTRSQAELHSSIMQFGNNVTWQSCFSVPAKVPMWVGNVFQGEYVKHLGRIHGSQVFIDKEFLPLLIRIGKSERLVDDMKSTVIRNEDRGQLNS